MFATQITNLASRRVCAITRNDLATLVRIQMCQSAIAVSAGRDGLVVNVVSVGTSDGLEALEVGLDTNTGAVAVGSERDLSGYGAVSKDSGITIWMN